MKQKALPLLALLMMLAGLLGATPGRADAPVEAGAAVHRLLDAFGNQDAPALLAALADDYDYNGLRKADAVPFGFGWLLPDRLRYRMLHLSRVAPDTVTSLVDLEFEGSLNLEAAGLGKPAVVGTGRLWIEVRQVRDRDWRVSAWRWVRLQYRHGDTPLTFVQSVRVNDRISLRLPAGASLRVEGETQFGLQQFNSIGSSRQTAQLDLEQNAQSFERWNVMLTAPVRPGRYYVESASLILVPRAEGGLYLSGELVSVPVIVE